MQVFIGPGGWSVDICQLFPFLDVGEAHVPDQPAKRKCYPFVTPRLRYWSPLTFCEK